MPERGLIFQIWPRRRLSWQALLRKALRDGFISPDVANALVLAARNINEDVADALLVAGRNINEDVADHLMIAGRNINEDVARHFDDVNHQLVERVRELKDAADSLGKVAGEINTAPQRSVPLNQFTQPDRYSIPRRIDSWRFLGALICGSSGAGLIAAVVLTRSHLGGQAVLAGIAALGIFALFWVTKTRR
jgi:hypothetical protein